MLAPRRQQRLEQRVQPSRRARVESGTMALAGIMDWSGVVAGR